MNCIKYNLKNTGDTVVTFNYQRCDNAELELQVKLAPNQNKIIWAIKDTLNIPNFFSNTTSVEEILETISECSTLVNIFGQGTFYYNPSTDVRSPQMVIPNDIVQSLDVAHSEEKLWKLYNPLPFTYVIREWGLTGNPPYLVSSTYRDLTFPSNVVIPAPASPGLCQAPNGNLVFIDFEQNVWELTVPVAPATVMTATLKYQLPSGYFVGGDFLVTVNNKLLVASDTEVGGVPYIALYQFDYNTGSFEFESKTVAINNYSATGGIAIFNNEIYIYGVYVYKMDKTAPYGGVRTSLQGAGGASSTIKCNTAFLIGSETPTPTPTSTTTPTVTPTTFTGTTPTATETIGLTPTPTPTSQVCYSNVTFDIDCNNAVIEYIDCCGDCNYAGPYSIGTGYTLSGICIQNDSITGQHVLNIQYSGACNCEVTPTPTPTNTSTPEGTPTPTPTETSILETPTCTPTVTQTPTPTNTETPTPTATSVIETPTPTPTETATSVIETPTPTPTETATSVIETPTPTPTETATSVIETPTPTPTNTETPTPTATSVIETPTPTPTCPYGDCYHYVEITVSGFTVIEWGLCPGSTSAIIYSADTYPATFIEGPTIESDCFSGNSYTILTGSTPVSLNYFNPCCDELVTPTPTPTNTETPTPTATEGITPTPTPTEEITPTPTPTCPYGDCYHYVEFTISGYSEIDWVYCPGTSSGQVYSAETYPATFLLGPGLEVDCFSGNSYTVVSGSTPYSLNYFNPCCEELVTPTPTPSQTSTPQVSPTCTPTESETPTPTPDVTPTCTPTESETPTPTPDVTPTCTPTESETPTPTPDVTPTCTPTESETPTPTPSCTPTLTPTSTQTCCQITILTNSSVDVNITDLTVNGSSATYVSGQALPNTPGNGTILCSTIVGVVDIRISVLNSVAAQKITLTDSLGNVQCYDITGTGPSNYDFLGVTLNCTTPITVLAEDGSCTAPPETPTPTPTAEVTPTPTPTEEVTPTPTITPSPSESPLPVSGFSYNLIALPYNLPSDGNAIMNNEPNNFGSTEINLLGLSSRGFYFNSIDTSLTDRTSYYSAFTGQTITITFTQNGDSAIYSGDTDSFKFWSTSGDTGFVFGTGIGVPPIPEPSGNAVLIQSATTTWVTGDTVYVSAVLNV